MDFPFTKKACVCLHPCPGVNKWLQLHAVRKNRSKWPSVVPFCQRPGQNETWGPLHQLSTSATVLHAQKWACALEFYLYIEIQYQPYFLMAFHGRNWEKLSSDLVTGRLWGTSSSPTHLSKRGEGFALQRRMWSRGNAFCGVPLLCDEKRFIGFLTKLLKEELLYLLVTCTYSL